MTETTTTTIPALLPCPFCGAEAELLKTIDQHSDYPRHWLIQCENGCASAETDGLEPDEAVSAWNRRAAPSPAPAATSAASVRDCLPAGHVIIEQADMPDGRVSQTVHVSGKEYQRIVSADEAYGPDDGAQPAQPDMTDDQVNAAAAAEMARVDALTEAAKRIAWAYWLSLDTLRPDADRDRAWDHLTDAAKEAWLSAARASAPAAPEVVENGVCVPLEPTNEMMSSGETAYGNEYIAYEGALPADVVCHSVYRAMISAALRSAGEGK